MHMGVCVCHTDDITGTFHYDVTQVTLNKFVHQCSSYLPLTLFVPFLHMLNGLCTGIKAAGYVFDALKAWQQPGAANNISWDHFFGSIQQYSLGLKQVNSSLILIVDSGM